MLPASNSLSPFGEQQLSESRQLLLIHTAANEDAVESVDGVEVLLDQQQQGSQHQPQQGPSSAGVIGCRRSDNDNDGSAQLDALPKLKCLAYALGHFYNDLCASMWFNYLLIFMEKVILLPNRESGLLMLIGQVTDALCTPLVGMLSDHSLLPAFLAHFGRRKSWHIIGTFCVTLSFPLIFTGCLLCNNFHWLRLVWFIPPIMIFQFGWASVQISHLAMIPELASGEHSRMSMTSYRYGFTVAANLSVFGLLFLFLANATAAGGGEPAITPADLPSFRNLGLITVGLGLAVTCLFYAGVSEPSSGQRRLSRLNSESGSHQQLERMAWHNWFRELHFYQCGALYLFSRVYINVSQIYLSFYIIQTQGLAKQFVALFPLIAYVASFFVSFLLGSPPISRRVIGKPLFMFGALLAFLNCALLFFTRPDWPFVQLVLYSASLLLGITQAILLICSLNTTAALINRNTESGAFVYGAMSFLDKLSNGVIVAVVELLVHLCCAAQSHGPHCAAFYRHVMAFVPGACVLAILLVLLPLDWRALGQGRMRHTLSGANNNAVADNAHRNFESPDNVPHAYLSSLVPATG